MKLFEKFEVYPLNTDREAVPRLRQLAGEMVQRVTGLGRVESTGIFPGKRGRYFVLNVDCAEELIKMVGDGHECVRRDVEPRCVTRCAR